MEDYIDPEWADAVTVGFSESIAKSSTKLVDYCSKNYTRYGHQWRCDVADKVAILLKPGEGYEWHFDNLDYTHGRLTSSRASRFWTHIVYLTEGKPFEIGTWNPKNERVLQTDFSAPEPDKIIARIYPKPGKTMYFPCFMVHRIQPVVDNYRWAFVDFVSSPNYLGKTKKDLTSIFNRYFDEYTRSQLLSPR
tara:strand:- start:5537 stop:6112 length:576 start_codon:yes stop_codon:yes gene_type:complete